MHGLASLLLEQSSELSQPKEEKETAEEKDTKWLKGVTKSPSELFEEALTLLNKCADRGYALSLELLGRIHYGGLNVERNEVHLLRLSSFPHSLLPSIFISGFGFSRIRFCHELLLSLILFTSSCLLGVRFALSSACGGPRAWSGPGAHGHSLRSEERHGRTHSSPLPLHLPLLLSFLSLASLSPPHFPLIQNARKYFLSAVESGQTSSIEYLKMVSGDTSPKDQLQMAKIKKLVKEDDERLEALKVLYIYIYIYWN